MRKYLFLIVFSIFVVGAACIIFVKSHPPLVIIDYKSFDEHEEGSVIEIENTGIRELQIQNVVVNGGLSGESKLMVSRGQTLESAMPSDPNITYHGIKQIKLFPSKYIDRKAVGQKPQHYGLKIEVEDIEKVTIHYKYLSMPFSLTAELKKIE